MEQKTVFREVRVFVASNGFGVSFSDYVGAFTGKTYFVAKTLEEVKKICEKHLIPSAKL